METWHLGTYNIPNFLRNFNIIQSEAIKINKKGRASSGLIIFYKKDVTLIKELYSSKDWIFIKIKVNNIIIIYGLVYLSPLLDNKICTQLYNILLDLEIHNVPIIINGDFNARLGKFQNDIYFSTMYLNKSRECLDNIVNQRGKIFINLINDLNLILLNGRSKRDFNGDYTFISTNGASCIDFSLINHLGINLIYDFYVDNNIESNHFPICTILNLNNLKPEIKQDTSIKWIGKYKDKFNNSLKNKIISKECFINLSEFLEYVNSSALEANMISTNTGNNHQPWFNKDCKQAKRECIIARKLAKSVKWEKPKRDHYILLRTLYKNLVNKSKSSYWKSRINLINNSTNPNEFWLLYKKLNYCSSTSNCIENRKWVEFYNNTLPIRELDNTLYFGPDIEYFARPFSLYELDYVIKKVKNGKAPGPDKVTNEFFKNISKESKETLLSSFNHILENENPPLEWSDCTTTMIYKKGDPTNPKNYRPIALLNTSLKLFSNLLNQRIITWVERNDILPEAQAGFRKLRGCEEQIFILNTLVYLKFQKNKKLYCAFFDFERAFPSINHHLLWERLYSTGISYKYINIMRKIYSKANTKMKLEDGFSEKIDLSEGVLQGEVCSPTFFSLYLHNIISYLKDEGYKGVKLGETSIYLLLFADDMVLVADSKESLQIKINALEKYFSKLYLKVNIDKTKVLIFQKHGRPELCTFYYNKTPIEIVNQYTYLGIVFSRSGTFIKAKNNLYNKANAAMYAVNNNIFKGKIRNWDVKFKLFDTVIVPTLLYSSNIWSIYFLDQMETIQNKYIRVHLGVSPQTHSSLIRLELNRNRIELRIIKNILLFLLRILKLPSNRYIHISLQQQIQALKANPIVDNWFSKVYKLIFYRFNELELFNNLNVNNLKRNINVIVRKISKLLKNEDCMQVREYILYKYYYNYNIINQSIIAPYLRYNLNLKMLKVFAQLRLNRTQIYVNKLFVNFNDSNCDLCNLKVPNTLYHFMFKCLINTGPRIKYLGNYYLQNYNESNFNAFFDLQDIKLIENIYYFVCEAMNHVNIIKELE